MEVDKLRLTLKKIADNPDWKDKFIKHILSFEKTISEHGLDVREEISGPLIDALFSDNLIVQKKIKDGTVFEFFYRSKIARDFIMSEPSTPNHAWEPQTTRLLLMLADGAQNVVIGGAYFGDQTILIAKKISKYGGVVHAFEPNNDQRKMLIRNAELNNLSNIITCNQGLWDNSKSSLKLVGYDSFAHPEIVRADDDEAFCTTTIDEYLSSKGVESLDLIMLDIEGAEYRALKGATQYLKGPADKAPSLVFEVHSHYVDWSNGLENSEIVKFLSELEYHIFAIRDFNSNYDLENRPIEIIPVKDVYLEGPDHGFNMVAVKDINFFKNTNFRICHGVSPKLLRHKDPKIHHPIDGLN